MASRATAEGSTRLTRWTRAGYASGDLGISIAYFAFGFFFLYYLTDLVGLPPALAGVVILIGKLWDGVNDPLIGALSDRTRSLHGRKRVYLLYGAVPFGVSFAILWWIPDGASETAKAALATALVLVFATTYSLVGVPYQALVPVISDDYDERTRLVGYKAVFSALGAILGGVIALAVSGGTDELTALRVMAVVFAVAIAVFVLVSARAVRRVAHAADAHPIAPVPFGHYVRLATEPNVATLMGYKTLGAIATGMLTAALPFFAIHVVESASSSTVSLAIYTVFGAGLVAVWVRLTHRFDKRRLILVANSAAAVILVAIAFLSGTGSSFVFLAGSALLGCAMAAYLVLPPSLVPDLVDWCEHESGERHESVLFGLWATFHQIGLGLAGLVLGLVLQWTGYVQGADIQGPEAVLGVRLAFGLVPAVFLVLAALLLQRYRITRERLAAAQASLGAARGAEAA